MSYDPMSLIKGQLESAEQDYEAAKEKFQETFNDDPSYTVEWKLTDVIQTQTMYQIAEQYGTDDEAIALFEKDMKRQMTYGRDGESQSSSQASNLVENIREARKLKLLGAIFEVRQYQEREAAKVGE
jgi:hypothetical protein